METENTNVTQDQELNLHPTLYIITRHRKSDNKVFFYGATDDKKVLQIMVNGVEAKNPSAMNLPDEIFSVVPKDIYLDWPMVPYTESDQEPTGELFIPAKSYKEFTEEQYKQQSDLLDAQFNNYSPCNVLAIAMNGLYEDGIPVVPYDDDAEVISMDNLDEVIDRHNKESEESEEDRTFEQEDSPAENPEN